MAVQLVNLRGAPQDEVEDLRRLLAEHGMDFYETPAGNWGISIPALWLRDESRLDEARAVVAEYQAARAVRARRDYEGEDRHRGLLDEARERPLRLIFYGAVIALVLYLSTVPFLDIGG